jgi:hypothetical protein
MMTVTRQVQFNQHKTGDFYLSAFGLIEPEWYVPPWPWWLVASMTGMGLLIGGAIVLTVGKRMRARR